MCRRIAPEAVRAAGLCGGSGWVKVDRATLATPFSGVRHRRCDRHPACHRQAAAKAGVFAHGQAEVVAHNIAAEITGTGTMTQFQGEGACFIEAGDARPVSQRQFLRRARTAHEAETSRTPAALGQGGLRKILAVQVVLVCANFSV